jgi:cupin domain
MTDTDTIDYDIILDGEITLEVDGGQSRVLKQGDIAVQYGTRHAWRNHSSKPATLIFVLIGAKRGWPFPLRRHLSFAGTNFPAYRKSSADTECA